MRLIAVIASALTLTAAPAHARTTLPAARPGAVMRTAARRAEGLRRAPAAADTTRFGYLDVFDLEWAGDPQISPDGSRVAFVRTGFDIMKDRERASLWVVNANGTGLRALTDGSRHASSPTWSPDGSRLAYVAHGEEGAEIRVRWLDTGQEAVLARLQHGPRGLAWSPDGTRLAFATFVPGEPPPAIAHMPPKPEGADWGPPIHVVDRVTWRLNGQGLLPRGHTHVFVLTAEGGTPMQVTLGPYDDGAPAWSPDGKTLYFSGDRHVDADYDPSNSEVYAVPAAGGPVRALTDRHGPDGSPAVSPDGSKVAYVGYDEHYQGYQVRRLYVMSSDGSGSRVLTGDFDRSVGSPTWAADGSGLFVQFDDQGDTKVGFVGLDGKVSVLADHVGGLSIGRPYPGGSFSVSASTGRFAFTQTLYDHPADVAVGSRKGGPASARRVTRLNDDLLAHRALATGEEITFESSYDGKEIQGWILKPPGFDAARKYPLILEIHGGPYLTTGTASRPRPALRRARLRGAVREPARLDQLRSEFGNAIHQDYPGHDYDDLMSGVDAVTRKGYVSAEQPVRHRRVGRRRPHGVDGRAHDPLPGRGRGQAGDQLVQLGADRGHVAVRAEVLVLGISLGQPAELHGALPHHLRRPHEDPDHDHDRRSGPADARWRGGAVLPGAQAAEGPLGHGAHPGRLPRDRRQAQQHDRQDGLHPGLVRALPGWVGQRGERRPMSEIVTVVGGGLAGQRGRLAAGRARARRPAGRDACRCVDRRPTTPGSWASSCARTPSRRGIPANAHGVLKREMEELGSLFLACGARAAVPAGSALAVDRELFARAMTAAVAEHPRIEGVREEIVALPDGPGDHGHGPAHLAMRSRRRSERGSGTRGSRSSTRSRPSWRATALDESSCSRRSLRRGRDDYLNCPMGRRSTSASSTRSWWRMSIRATNGRTVPYFEGCLPIEVMASRGRDTLRFGPMKPIGLADPRTGSRPHAVVQLRREDREGQQWNMVGFQTRLRRRGAGPGVPAASPAWRRGIPATRG